MTLPLADWYSDERDSLPHQLGGRAESSTDDGDAVSTSGDCPGADSASTPLEPAVTEDRANDLEIQDDAAPIDPLPVATLFEQEVLQRLASPVTEQPFRALLDELTAKNSYLLPSCLLFCSTRSTPRSAETLAHLAILLGENAEDVLLVDANLAEQTLTRHYQALGEPGICDAFSGETSALHVIRSTSRPHVYMVPAGDDVTGISRDASQLVPSTISASLQIWKQHFHRILIDVGAVDSTLLETLTAHAETLMLVIPAPCPADSALSKLVQRLSELPANLLGVVLTDFPSTPD